MMDASGGTAIGGAGDDTRASTGAARRPDKTQAKVHREFITAENVNAVFERHKVPRVFDLLSIDVDGNDYWIWKALGHRPRAVVIEYNAHIPPGESRSIAYDPGFKWSLTDYFGASLLALARLGKAKGYELVYCEKAGVNAFFVEATLARRHFLLSPVEGHYRPPNYGYRGLSHPKDPERKMIEV